MYIYHCYIIWERYSKTNCTGCIYILYFHGKNSLFGVNERSKIVSAVHFTDLNLQLKARIGGVKNSCTPRHCFVVSTCLVLVSGNSWSLTPFHHHNATKQIFLIIQVFKLLLKMNFCTQLHLLNSIQCHCEYLC